jgi:hypothetical protein
MHIGKRLRRIALQSALGGMAASVLGMIAASFGYLPPIEGAIGQELIDLLAVLNAVRLSLPTRELHDCLPVPHRRTRRAKKRLADASLPAKRILVRVLHTEPVAQKAAAAPGAVAAREAALT